MKVHMLSTADEAIDRYARVYYDRLLLAAHNDKFKIHTLTDSPSDADLILFIGSTYLDHRDVRAHPYLRTYPQKCFMFHNNDQIIPILPGVYVNIAKRWYCENRTRVGAYIHIMAYDYVPYIPGTKNCPYLFSFMGSVISHRVRKEIMKLDHPRGYVLDSSAKSSAEEKQRPMFTPAYSDDDRTHYGKVLSDSKFVLAPRGYGCSSWRIFEAMRAGRVPVIISDQWVEPRGPEWKTFSIRVRQRDVRKIPEILERTEPEAECMGQLAREAWDDWFSKESCFHRIVEWCSELKSQQAIPITARFHMMRWYFVRHVILPELKQALLWK